MSHSDKNGACRLLPSQGGGSDQRLRLLNDRDSICVPHLREGKGSFRVFTEGDDLNDAMIAAINGARKDIRLESVGLDRYGSNWSYALKLHERVRYSMGAWTTIEGSNYSWNCGWEGDDKLPREILKLRKQQIKNFCCLLFLSNGTPMFRAGDEFMQTQGGNNNPYNQDNETTWIDWDRLQANQDVFPFFKLMIAFRKAHPSLSRSRFWRDDIHRYGVGPVVDMSYHSHSLAFHLRGPRSRTLIST